jgi:hypothetical protein
VCINHPLHRRGRSPALCWASAGSTMPGTKMLPCGLLWKYLGLDAGQPRTSFLHDGLFRITQARFLNDPFEMKPRVLLDRYSDEDWAVARERARLEFPSGGL